MGLKFNVYFHMMISKIFSLLFIVFFLFVAPSCKKKGCTNPNASNYDSTASKDDGSCVYSGQTTQTAFIRVQSVCGDQNTITEHIVTCAESQAASDYLMSNIGTPCLYYTFTDINGNSISGYLTSLTSC